MAPCYLSVMAHTAQVPYCLKWAAALLATLFFVPAIADAQAKQDGRDKAVGLMMKAQSSTDANEQSQSLELAIEDLKSSQFFSKHPSRRESTIALIQSAISDLDSHNTDQFNQDITQAIGAANYDPYASSQPPATGAFGTTTPAPTPAPVATLSGTKWTSKSQDPGGVSVIQFGSDGKFTEDSKTQHHSGTWQAKQDSSTVVVKRDDNQAIEYHLTDGKNLIRTLGSVSYQPVISPTPTTASANPSTSSGEGASPSSSSSEDTSPDNAFGTTLPQPDAPSDSTPAPTPDTPPDPTPAPMNP